jgi:periplasmic protein TonB
MNGVLIEQLDEQIDAMLSGNKLVDAVDPLIRELTLVAAELRCVPTSGFRDRLSAELARVAEGMWQGLERRTRTEELGPSVWPLSGREACEPPHFNSLQTSPVDRTHLAASFALHVAAMAGILTSGLWMVEHRTEMSRQVASLLTDSPYILAPSRSEAHGGGGGGDGDKMQASKGTAPRFAQEQLTPPTVIVRNEDPKLAAEPTLVGPPDVLLPQSSQAGDPLAKILSSSNGPGSGGGIGSGQSGGIGSGRGPGLGPGEGGGLGGGVFHVGGGVGAPRVLYSPEPEFSEEARKAKHQGAVVLAVVVGSDGRPRDLRVISSLGMGLDEKAVEAVRKWRFEPARKDGLPVAVQVQVEVAFRLY